MKKIALFVEGQTEQIFIQKLIEQVISPNKVTVSTYQLRGGAKHTRNLIMLKTQTITQQTDYYFAIYDCGLQLIYRYTKNKNKVHRIVNALDYANLYINVKQRNNSLAELLTHLDSVFP
ncbi:MAG: hypothetical protein LBJ72_01000 [Dysgonamonadaceae bacterium]|jgi:hypothetical protein|nr:hypothetical protein [Dysgonamonadaceae bacterium]